MSRRRLLRFLGLGVVAAWLSYLAKSEAAPPAPSLLISKDSLVATADVVVVKEDGVAKAIDARSKEVVSEGSDHVVLQDALSSGLYVKVLDNLALDDTVETTQHFQILDFSMKKVTPPASGPALRVKHNFCTVENLRIVGSGTEVGVELYNCTYWTLRRLWLATLSTGLKATAENAGVTFGAFRDSLIYNVSVGVDVEIAGTGFFTDSEFQNVRFYKVAAVAFQGTTVNCRFVRCNFEDAPIVYKQLYDNARRTLFQGCRFEDISTVIFDFNSLSHKNFVLRDNDYWNVAALYTNGSLDPTDVVDDYLYGVSAKAVHIRTIFQIVADWGGGFANFDPAVELPDAPDGTIVLVVDTNSTTPGQRIYAKVNGNWHYVDLA